ncbi:hypothetical protein JVT61DRAFT_12963 [Boletus reticuloceps]|uniref:Uncharacterized protein n=1 Tax=Boletus reticuloceps TaxID=495285 RepID=A0A8I2YWN1_9AGAM|nr:hypothetical protein JVT61DRAFT_12963 [Boletus reticuloceps]
MDKHLTVRSTSGSSLHPLTVLLVEIGAKILCHAVHSCICGKRTMVGRTVVCPGPSVRGVLRGWCLKGSPRWIRRAWNNDVFETAVLELRLSQSGVLQKTENSFNLTYSVGHRGPARDNLRRGNEDDEDFDLDD